MRSAMKKKIGEFNKKIFISEAVNDMYETLILSKIIILQRGFTNLGENQNQSFILKLALFYLAACSHNISIVRKFYANVREYKDFKVIVRAKWVPFDNHSINNIYNHIDVENDDYISFHRGVVYFEGLTLGCLRRGIRVELVTFIMRA